LTKIKLVREKRRRRVVESCHHREVIAPVYHYGQSGKRSLVKRLRTPWIICKGADEAWRFSVACHAHFARRFRKKEYLCVSRRMTYCCWSLFVYSSTEVLSRSGRSETEEQRKQLHINNFKYLLTLPYLDVETHF